MTAQRKQINQQPIFKAMTRPPTIGGVNYSYWALMLLFSMSGIIVLKSFLWFFGLLAFFYILGRLVARHDPFLIEIMITQLSECPMQRNQTYWGCRSYEPW